jgi:hypothetical protein
MPQWMVRETKVGLNMKLEQLAGTARLPPYPLIYLEVEHF